MTMREALDNLMVELQLEAGSCATSDTLMTSSWQMELWMCWER